MPDPVVIAYRPEWADQFQAEAAQIVQCIGGLLFGAVEHIGSTAIPGMLAKPQIDMMAPVGDLDSAVQAARRLVAHGYSERPHRRDAVLTVKGAAHASDLASAGSHSLHLTTTTTDLWIERLLFRDTLRHDARLRAQYTGLKQQMLASDDAYSSSFKLDFIRQVLASTGHTLRDDLKVDP